MVRQAFTENLDEPGRGVDLAQRDRVNPNPRSVRVPDSHGAEPLAPPATVLPHYQRVVKGDGQVGEPGEKIEKVRKAATAGGQTAYLPSQGLSMLRLREGLPASQISSYTATSICRPILTRGPRDRADAPAA